LIFQAIDDKKECIGVYAEGRLHYEDFPQPLTGTWKYTGSIEGDAVDYAMLWSNGCSLKEACPANLQEALHSVTNRMKAYRRSFELGKINIREHCIFDLIPEDFLMEYCDVKNQISAHVFETYKPPAHYEHLVATSKLLHKIKYQELNLTNENCKELYYSSRARQKANELIKNYRYIDYNLFGTVTGRLTTYPASFPVLTLKKEFRKLLKPQHKWFLSLDYNAAEVRTLLALSGHEQPQEDLHRWNMINIYHDADETFSRDEAKLRFFAWLYDPTSEDGAAATYYDRDKVLDKWYSDGYINTPFKRLIKVEPKKALNYLIQSTTSDVVLDRAIALDKFLSNYSSFVSHIVHDEIVIDLCDKERHLVPDIKEIFASTRLGNYLPNLQCGTTYYDLKELNL